MARLKSTLTDDEANPADSIIPERIQRLTDLYKKNKVLYELNEEDKQEKDFEWRRSRRPNTYRYSIYAVYRVRDPVDRKKEYYFYAKEGKCLNDSNATERSGTHIYGFAVEPQTEVQYDPALKKNVPKKVKDNPTYFYKWDAKEVAKLLEGSDTPCRQFYIGEAGMPGQGNIDMTKPKVIKNQSNFLNGKFDDLLVLNEVNLTGEDDALTLVEKAREQKAQKTLERIARHVASS